MKTIDFERNYEDCAQFWAKHIGQPFGVNVYHDLNILSIYNEIYPETIETIEIDPVAFSERVKDYLYGLSFDKKEEA